MGFNWAFKGLNAEINSVCHLLGLSRAHHILHVSRIRVKGKIVNLLTPYDPYSRRTAPLPLNVAFYIFIQQIQVLNILNTVYTVRFFFSSKCSLFHNYNVFGSCFIHILYRGCVKIKKK